MSERQLFKHEPGMGLKAGDQGAQKHEKDIDHDGANFGVRCGEINGFDGIWRFRYPHLCSGDVTNVIDLLTNRRSFDYFHGDILTELRRQGNCFCGFSLYSLGFDREAGSQARETRQMAGESVPN